MSQSATPVPGPRLAYDDLDSLAAMGADCRAAAPQVDRALARAAQAAVRPAPSILFEDQPREVAKRPISDSAAAAHVARALGLDV